MKLIFLLALLGANVHAESCALTLSGRTPINMHDRTRFGFFRWEKSQLPPMALAEIATLTTNLLGPSVPPSLTSVSINGWNTEHFLHRILIKVKLELNFGSNPVPLEIARHFDYVNLKSLSTNPETDFDKLATARLFADVLNHSAYLYEHSLHLEVQALINLAARTLNQNDATQIEAVLLEAARPRLLESEAVGQGYLLREYFYAKERLVKDGGATSLLLTPILTHP